MIGFLGFAELTFGHTCRAGLGGRELPALVLGLGATPVTCHTAADHITVLDQTLAQLPDAHRR